MTPLDEARAALQAERERVEKRLALLGEVLDKLDWLSGDSPPAPEPLTAPADTPPGRPVKLPARKAPAKPAKEAAQGGHVCVECGFQGKNAQSLATHRARKHSGRNWVSRPAKAGLAAVPGLAPAPPQVEGDLVVESVELPHVEPGGRSHTCPACPASYSNARLLDGHILNRHGSTTPDLDYVCEGDCGFVSGIEALTLVHERTCNAYHDMARRAAAAEAMS